MTITTEKSIFGDSQDVTVECDSCSETEELEDTSFQAAVKQIKQDGWRVECNDGDWEHTCPSCVELERKPMR